MSERFAIYYAPATASPLWQRAAAWLGRDPATGARCEDDVAGLARGRLSALSAAARRYGFHATLKAPFALADGSSRDALEAALAQFVRRRRPVPVGRLRPALLDGFLALLPERQDAALTGFAADCVAAFEGFRRPMQAEERQRRHAGGLSPRQAELLERYGYPYVMEQFRFHMTLTDRLAEVDRDELAAAAASWFGPALEPPLAIERLVLFHQPAAGADFVRAADFPLAMEAAVDA